MKRAIAAVVAMAGVTYADARHDIAVALEKRDIAAIKRFVREQITVGDMWFGVPACERFQGRDVKVEPEQLDRLVKCIADLGVRDVERGFVTATYGPGIPLIPVINEDGSLFGLFSLPSGWPEAIMIETQTFLGHLSSPKVPAVEALVTACVDTKGTINHMIVEPFDQRVVADVRAWKVKPFTMRGKRIAACTRLAVTATGDVKTEMPGLTDVPQAPPGGPPPPQNVPPTALEATRTGGGKVIVPDNKTKVEITIAKKDRLIGSFKLCLDTAGTVIDVSMLQSTGFAAYDEKIQRTIKTTWTYAPYQVNAKPVPVCTAVTIIYTQK